MHRVETGEGHKQTDDVQVSTHFWPYRVTTTFWTLRRQSEKQTTAEVNNVLSDLSQKVGEMNNNPLEISD